MRHIIVLNSLSGCLLSWSVNIAHGLVGFPSGIEFHRALYTDT